MGISFIGAGLQGGFSVGLAGAPPPPPPSYTLWAWGNGGSGRLGLGDTANRSSPTQVGVLTDWIVVEGAAGHALAIKTDGSLWTWGSNTNGQLGDGFGSGNNRSSPVQVGSLTDWSYISAVSSQSGHSHAIKTDGSLWAWGRGATGQLGLGDIDNRSSPVQVGNDTNWASVSGAFSQTHAIKTDGSLWAWGRNSDRSLGDGTTIDRSSPVPIGSLTNWAIVSDGQAHSMAIKTDGTLWAWGTRANGYFGDGKENGFVNSPIQIGNLTNWAKLATTGKNNQAVKTDGTLWVWGRNHKGHLGLGDMINRSSPVQVGNLTNWASIGAGGYSVGGLKTDGTIWAWGQNYNGEGGNSTVTPQRSSPIQIGTDSDWTSIDGSSSRFFAIKTT